MDGKEMQVNDEGNCGFGLVAVKRRWIPEWLFIMFAPVIPMQPFRWMFTTPMEAGNE